MAAALAAGWDLVVDEIEYAPVGFGSHHWRASAKNQRWFVTVDDLDARGRDAADTRDGASARLTAALGAARALRAAGLAFVIAPLPTRTGDVARRVVGRYLAAVYEHVEGVTHGWGAYPSRADRLAVLDRLVALHHATATAHDVARADDFVIPSRDQLLVALTDHDSSWGPGPHADKARRLLRRHAADVSGALARYDGLVAEVARSPQRFVITHGEPHRANTITTAAGVVLVDWDTALLAPPERDLWMLIDDEPGIAGDYTARTGVEVDPASVQLYRLWWDLCEISLYTADLRAAHADTEEAGQAWGGLREYLDPPRWKSRR